MSYARTLAAFALVVAAFAALASILTSGSPAQAAHAVQAPAPVVQVAEVPGGAHTADEAFLADLLGPDTDTTPEHALLLTDLAERYCEFVVEGNTLPGAEVQTREGWIEGLTMPGPHAFTVSEAGKLLDTAEAAYCPSRV